MNLKNPSENIQNETNNEPSPGKKRRPVIIVVLGVGVIIALAILLYMGYVKKTHNVATLCDAYNSAVDQYNTEAEKYNTMLDAMAKFNIEGLPDKISVKDKVSQDSIDSKTLDSLEAETQSLDDEITAIDNDMSGIATSSINYLITSYNTVASAYNELVQVSSIEYLEDLPEIIEIKDQYQVDNEESVTLDSVCERMNQIDDETEALVESYLVVQQITNPSEEWVVKRLNSISSITGTQAVTEKRDPNGLLGKEGGYTSCIYFSVKSIDASSVNGTDIVDKGADVGGAIEVYESKEDALNRCDYLSQFDGTLLYSGSYVIIGTMVIRSSYKLSNSEQIELTNEIVETFTQIQSLEN